MGSWSWHQKKWTTDDVKSLDVRVLRRKDTFARDGVATLSWSNGNGDTVGSIQVETTEKALVFRYHYQQGNGPWQEVREIVQLGRTPCHYGGQRPWFLCPGCGRRVALLYAAGPRFRCRHCYQLPYASQNETDMDRMARKARKIRRRLEVSYNLSEPVLWKPKGMHQTTFDLLRWKEMKAHGAYGRALAGALVKLKRAKRALD